MVEADQAGTRRGSLGAPLMAFLGVVTLANLWAAFRIGWRIWDSITHYTFFRGGNQIYWSYPTTIPLVVSAGAALVALAGLLLLVMFGGALLPAMVGVAVAGLLTVLVLQRRDAFR